MVILTKCFTETGLQGRGLESVTLTTRYTKIMIVMNSFNQLQGLNINVFVSHLHAEYNRANDMYVGHRVSQALEAAQWIKLTSSGADLTIYAGDFNSWIAGFSANRQQSCIFPSFSQCQLLWLIG